MDPFTSPSRVARKVAAKLPASPKKRAGALRSMQFAIKKNPAKAVKAAQAVDKIRFKRMAAQRAPGMALRKLFKL